MPSVMRILFTQILVFGNCFWQKSAENFISHVKRSNLSKDFAVKRVCPIIASKVNTMTIESQNFCFWVERYGMDDIETY